MRLAHFLRTAASLFVVMTMSISSIGCSTSSLKVRQDVNTPHLWVIENDKVKVEIDAKLGRIMHYGFHGQENAFWINMEAADDRYDVGGWDNWGGDKVWPWPQELWNWPPPEPSYQLQAMADGEAIIMTSDVIDKVGARIKRIVELECDGTLVVTSRLEPASAGFGQPLSAWSITQIPTPQKLLARVPLASDRKRYLNRTIRDNFSARPVSDRVLEISVSDQGGKTFMDADVIAAIYPGYVLLLQQHPIHEEGAWAPDEKAQVYAHPTNATNVPEGRSYYELEFCAPVLPPNRVNKAPLRVTYKLIKRRAQTTDEQIVEMIESIAWKR